MRSLPSPTLATVVVLTALALAAPTPTPAAEVSAAQGGGADAEFASLDPSGCLRTAVSVSVREQRLKGEPGQSAATFRLFVTLEQDDACRQRTVLRIFREVELAAGEFALMPAGRGATLQATLDVFDWISHRHGTVVVDLTWTSEGAVFKSHGSQTFLDPLAGTRVMTHTHGNSREAQTAGSVWLDGTDMTAGPASSAIVYLSQTTRVSIDTRRD